MPRHHVRTTYRFVDLGYHSIGAVVKRIVVGVKIQESQQTIARAECAIELPASGKVDPGKLIDACQRSVAHCIDELEKHLDR